MRTPRERWYLRPAALHTSDEAALVAAGAAVPILGGRFACPLLEVIRRDADERLARRFVPATDLGQLPEPLAEALARIRAPRPAPFDRLLVMGILNVTPDSFSDGGEHGGVAAAVAHGLRMVEEGADIVNVGGESTRPGALPVPVEVELARVLPVVERLAAVGVTVSIDTRKAAVMRAAVAVGAQLINDVSGLAHDPDAPAAAAASGAAVVLMHLRGEPATMNEAPSYTHPALEVMDELAQRIAAAEASGIRRSRLIVDPGLCFAKHEPHNLDILRNLALLHGLGCPLLVGVSRKGWTAWLDERHPPKARLPASLAAGQWALAQGAQILRVHDVAATRQMVEAWRSLAGVGAPGRAECPRAMRVAAAPGGDPR